MPLRARPFKSLYTRMFLVICAAAIPTFVGLYYYVQQQRSYLVQFSTDNAQRFVQLAAHDETWLFTSTRATLTAIAASPMVKNGQWMACHEYLASLLQNQTAYRDFGVMSVEGHGLCSGLQHPDVMRTKNFGDRSYFQRALQQDGLIVSEFHLGRVSNRPILLVAMALRDEDENPEAVLYASIDISSMVRERQKSQLGPDSRIMLLDRNNIVLTAFPPQPDQVGREVADKNLIEALRTEHSGSRIVREKDDSEWLISHTRTGTAEDPQALTVVYKHPTGVALAGINNHFWISTAITALLALLALVLGWVTLQAFVGRNIKSLNAAARRLGKRQFHTRASKTVTGLEFKQIALQFDKMARELGRQERQWKLSLQRQQEQNRILKLIARNSPLEDTLRALTLLVQEQLPNTAAAVLLLDSQGTHVEACIGPSLPAGYPALILGAAIDQEAGSSGTAMYRRQEIISSDIERDAYWGQWRQPMLDLGLRSCWALPILAPDDKVLGSFTVYGYAPHRPSADELQLARTAAELAALALEHSRQSQALWHQSRHDSLTGLYNRNVLLAQLERAILEAKQSDTRFYLMIIDLDGFKEINDTLGHALADDLLKQVSSRLSTGFDRFGHLARSGSNDFACVFREGDLPCSIEELAQLVLDEIKKPFVVEGIHIQISASIGITRYPEGGSDVNELLRNCNWAMYQAKREGTGHALYDPGADKRSSSKLMLLSDLRRALHEREFVLHYQPKLHLKTGRLVGFETLIRWQHPHLGLVYPGEFISAVEFSDLIHPLTLWALEAAIEQCKDWHDRGYEVSVAVNISARNLLSLDFPASIRRVLERYALPPHQLELEITESAIMLDTMRAMQVLQSIHDIGVRIAIDDFGTGHSSLAYLQKLPVDNLKIDRSFIMDMNADETPAIVNSIIRLAHHLKVTVTAEGVESEITLRQLGRLRCDYAQGFHIARPMHADAAFEWMKNHS